MSVLKLLEDWAPKAVKAAPEVVAPVPPLATGNVPVTSEARSTIAAVAAIPYPCPTFQ